MSDRVYLWDHWVAQAKAMYFDEVITYKAPKGPFRRQFKKLAAQTDLNFKRVRRDKDADIICEYANTWVDGSYTTRRYDGSYLVQVDPTGAKEYNLEAHEIGHTLGLFDSSRKKSVMNPDNAYDEDVMWLSPWDRNNITELLLGRV